MTKVLVTGGDGFLGVNVVEALRNKYEVHSCSRKSGVDIRNYPEFERFIKDLSPDIVVHCAAHVGGIAYNKLKPVEVFEDNVHIGLNTVKGCHNAGVKHFINIMPNCTYPGDFEEYREEEWWDGPMHETVLTYGLPRKMIWGACFAYGEQYHLKSLHLILPNMYGPGDHFDPIRSHALGALIAKIVEAKVNKEDRVEIWGTGKPVREWLYVKDAAQGIALALEKTGRFQNNDIVNLGIGEGISIADLANLIKEIVGWKGEFTFDTSRADGAKQKILIADKMRKMLDWEPPTSFKEGVKETINWYSKEHRE